MTFCIGKSNERQFKFMSETKNIDGRMPFTTSFTGGTFTRENGAKSALGGTRATTVWASSRKTAAKKFLKSTSFRK